MGTTIQEQDNVIQFPTTEVLFKGLVDENGLFDTEAAASELCSRYSLLASAGKEVDGLKDYMFTKMVRFRFILKDNGFSTSLIDATIQNP